MRKYLFFFRPAIEANMVCVILTLEVGWFAADNRARGKSLIIPCLMQSLNLLSKVLLSDKVDPLEVSWPASGEAEGWGREGEDDADECIGDTSDLCWGRDISSFFTVARPVVDAGGWTLSLFGAAPPEVVVLFELLLDVDATKSGRFLQSKHLHWEEHISPDWKHSQYFFRQPLFLQWQPDENQYTH